MIYLKFDNELQAHMVLDEYMTRDTETSIDEDSGETTVTEVGDKYFIGKQKSLTKGAKAGQWELWVRGTLFVKTGEVTQNGDGEDVPVMEALKGFHVDLDPKLGSHDLEEWTEQGYIQAPTNPQFTKG